MQCWVMFAGIKGVFLDRTKNYIKKILSGYSKYEQGFKYSYPKKDNCRIINEYL